MLVEQADQTVLLTPEQCHGCQQDLSEVSPCRKERVQVFDLPTVHLQVTEYHVEVKACPCCQAETRAALPDGLTPASAQYGPNVKTLAVYLACLHLLPLARVCQILGDLFGDHVFAGQCACGLSAERERRHPGFEEDQNGLAEEPSGAR